MEVLLHIDTSLRTEGSVSREVTAAFAEAWREAHPGAGYAYRDLGVDPLPHLDAAALASRMRGEESPLARELGAELEAADTVLLGTPMYNFTITSSLKAWLDWVTQSSYMADRETGRGALSGKRVVVVTARGGSYAPGTPREGFDFQEPYLKAAFSLIGLHHDLEFVHAEMTNANLVPDLAQFKDLAATSLAEAHRNARTLAAA
ncbi:NAD(P)H-dependent oxidoreductase [Actinosynnema pretiosum subsp. pretiosum]|uniref:FMN dependent NADH:quinone oxidoreductase n=1 Tax=Actinosynnema pretiosum subsp. pretiosum TaxID=103721 RepID=A0AA45LDN2_9PSEU|nr:NAD(P)H-dependent oxidoreductase [Actinosynnema pretiosum subsp. pretiosum]